MTGRAARRAAAGRGARTIPLLLGLLLALGSGCAYFNTFYHAREHFYEAEKVRLETAGEPKPPAGPPGGDGATAPRLSKRALDLYEKCMKKCAKILTDYEDSRWVDDALLLMGKCAIARGEYATGIRKYEELLEFYPNSDLVADARLHVGVAHLEEGAAAVAIPALEAAAADTKRKDLATDAHYHLARAHLALGDSAAAAAELESFLAGADKHLLRKTAIRTLGAIELARGNPARAREVYEMIDASPRADWKGYREARLAIAACLREEGRYDDARAAYTALLARATDVRDSAEIALDLALIVGAGENDSLTVAAFEDVSRRFPRTEAAARAQYEKGVIFYDRDADLERARGALDSVAVHAGQIPQGPIAKERSRVYAKRLALDDRLATRLQRIAAAAQEPEPAPEAALAGADSAGALAAVGDSAGSTAAPGDSASSTAAAGDSASPSAAPGESAGAPPPTPPPPGAGHADPRGVDDDEGLALSPGDSALARGDSALAAADSAAIANAPPAMTSTQYLATLSADSLASLVALADSAAREDLAAIYVEIGEVELLDLQRTEKALAAYERVAEWFPGSPQEPRALLAIAWIRGNRFGRTAEADSLYWRILSEYGETEFARGAALALGMEVPLPEVDPDSLIEASLAWPEPGASAPPTERREAPGRDQEEPPAVAVRDSLVPPPGFEDPNAAFFAGDSANAAMRGAEEGESPMDLLAPRPLTLAEPVYTPEMQELGLTGKVRVEVMVGLSGNVLDAQVVESENVDLNGAAIEAALRSTFTPPRGVDRVVVTFKFPPGDTTGTQH